MTPSQLEDQAVRDFAAAARRFSALTPRKNPTGAYARALDDLVQAALVMARTSDEAWAAEVVELRALIGV